MIPPPIVEDVPTDGSSSPLSSGGSERDHQEDRPVYTAPPYDNPLFFSRSPNPLSFDYRSRILHGVRRGLHTDMSSFGMPGVPSTSAPKIVTSSGASTISMVVSGIVSSVINTGVVPLVSGVPSFMHNANVSTPQTSGSIPLGPIFSGPPDWRAAG